MSKFSDFPKNIVNLPGDSQLPKIPVAGIRAVLLLVIVGVVLMGSLYQVDPEEVGVVLRFGKYARTTNPGLHFKAPLGVEAVEKVPVQRQLKQEFGFRTERPGVRSQFTRSGLEGESLMLTGDLNTAVVEWVVQYRVEDPKEFLFKVRRVEETLSDMSEAVMRQIVGDRTVDEVLTVGRQEVADLAELRLQELCEQYETGIKIEQIVLQNVNPPDPVRPSFNEVNQAEQEKETKINQAQSAYNKVIFRAKGEAQQTISNAEGYALDRVNRAKGQATRFDAVYREYRKAPQVTRRRIYLETMGEILPKMGNKLILDEGLEGIVPLLDFKGMAGIAGSGAARTGGDQ
jgi:membrane protease subunit HflK